MFFLKNISVQYFLAFISSQNVTALGKALQKESQKYKKYESLHFKFLCRCVFISLIETNDVFFTCSL